MYRHILIPTDGSTLSMKAAKAGARLAKSLGAKVTAAHVIAPFSPPFTGEGYVYPELYDERAYKADARRHAEKSMAKVEKVVRASKVRFDSVVVTERTPWEGIIKAARRKRCDLVVMASHGRRGIAGVILGSETTQVLTHSKIPVLVCR